MTEVWSAVRVLTVALVVSLGGAYWAWRAFGNSGARQPAKPKSRIVWVRLSNASVNVPHKEEQEWNIREAAFRHQFKRSMATQPAP